MQVGTREDEPRTDGKAEERPMGGYATTLAAYAAYAGACTALVHRHGRAPERHDAQDIALTAIATFRISRLLTKGAVTSPLRRPFTTYEGTTGPAEVGERPRHGLRHTAGELLTCPFCMSVWVSTTLTAGRCLWPRATRAVLAVAASVAGADALQLAYSGLMEKVTRGE